MTSKVEVCELHDLHPDWTAAQLARQLGCTANFVHGVKYRTGIVLPSAPMGRPRKRAEPTESSHRYAPQRPASQRTATPGCPTS